MRVYSLTRSKRKTLALYIRGGVLDVRAPLKMPVREIDKFIALKEKWIAKKLATSQEQTKFRENFRLDYGDEILYLGEKQPIIVREGNRIGFDSGFYMPPSLSPEQIKSACVQIYRLLAKRDITNRVIEFSKKMAVTPATVKINNAQSRWGSCSSKRSLNFSWRLIMADSVIVDYVVVHELAHLAEMNHSKKFWAIVEKILPDYKEREKRLRALNRRLSKEDWKC